MRILALDVGEKRIGMAISDPSGIIAQAAGVIIRRSKRQVIAEIRTRVAEYDAARIVVGLPLRMDGAEGEAAASVRKFVDDLRRAVTVTVDVQDERLSTAEADRAMIAGGVRRLRRRASRDAVAAALFLQTYLDRRRH
jgi:putative Holliday junction resolvase